MNDNRPIGVFDSGLGGLTTVSELKKVLPGEDIIYFGDTGRVPYGTRSRDIIKKYTMQDIAFLLSKDVKLIIVACNTASAVLTKEMIDGLPVPLLEVITPAANAAVRATKNKAVGVIATPATIKSGAYEKVLLKSGVEILKKACPLFVPLVESGFVEDGNEITLAVAKQYLKELKNSRTDTLILGCTHYPIIKNAISAVMGKEVTLIDSGREVAEVARETLKTQKIENLHKSIGVIRCFVSDSAEAFGEAANAITGGKLNVAEVLQIDIENY